MNIIKDFRYSLRLLAKKPGFSALTITVMALGLGLSVYLFSFLHTQIFQDLPFEDGGDIVQIFSSRNAVRNQGTLNLHDFEEIRNNQDNLTEFSAFRVVTLNVSGRDGARRHNAVAAESNIFRVARVEPALGRDFQESDNLPGAKKVVAIGHDIWQNQFSGDPAALGQTLRINGEEHEIITVMPEGFFFPHPAELWVPLQESAASTSRETAGAVTGLARLRGDASLQEVNNGLAVIMQRIAQRYPSSNTGINAYVDYVPRAIVGDAIGVVYSLHVIAILLLILASVNVANLLLSRAIEREKETAIRAALGAPRFRLMGQMVWESVIICVTGAVVGVLLLAWGLELTEKITAAYSVDRAPFWWQFGLDGYTLSLVAAFLVVTLLVTGAMPAWKNSGSNFNAVLRDGTRGAQSKKAGRLSRVLVSSEIFVALTVLIAASVMVVVNFHAVSADYGATTTDTMTAAVAFDGSRYTTPASKTQFVDTLESRLENSPLVGDVMIASALPGAYADKPAIAIEGNEYTDEGGYPRANYITVATESLQKLGVELKGGRYFNSGDDGLGKATIIVTESFTERMFPDEDSPIGRRVRLAESSNGQLEWMTIVGVVQHTYQGASFEEDGRVPSIFRPYSQAPQNNITVALRMQGDDAEIIQTLRDTLTSIDPEMPAFKIETYADKIGRFTTPLIFFTSVFMMFGFVAAVLAVSGIFGVMSNSVNQRVQEIGVKRAIGATEQRIVRDFVSAGVRQFLWGAIPGILLGCGMGFGMTKVLPVGLFELFAIAVVISVVIFAAVLLGCYLPTRRALAIEPIEALRFQ